MWVCVHAYLVGVGILGVVHWHLWDHDPSKVGIGVRLQRDPERAHSTTVQKYVCEAIGAKQMLKYVLIFLIKATATSNYLMFLSHKCPYKDCIVTVNVFDS